MRRFHKRCLIAGLVVVLCVGGWRLSVPEEPRYQGKSISEWFYSISSSGGVSSSDPGVLAIEQIGGDATPYLMKQLRWSNSEYHHHAINWANQWLHMKFLPDNERTLRAYVCLRQLGARAGSAVPELVEMLGKPHYNNRGFALGLVGYLHSAPESAIPLLHSFIKGSDPMMRGLAIEALGRYGFDAHASLPVLAPILDETGADQLAAAIATFRIDPSDKRATAILIKRRNDQSDPSAQALIPEMIEEQCVAWRTKADPSRRDQLAEGLKTIDPQAAKNAGIR